MAKLTTYNIRIVILNYICCVCWIDNSVSLEKHYINIVHLPHSPFTLCINIDTMFCCIKAAEHLAQQHEYVAQVIW